MGNSEGGAAGEWNNNLVEADKQELLVRGYLRKHHEDIPISIVEIIHESFRCIYHSLYIPKKTLQRFTKYFAPKPQTLRYYFSIHQDITLYLRLEAPTSCKMTTHIPHFSVWIDFQSISRKPIDFPIKYTIFLKEFDLQIATKYEIKTSFRQRIQQIPETIATWQKLKHLTIGIYCEIR